MAAELFPGMGDEDEEFEDVEGDPEGGDDDAEDESPAALKARLAAEREARARAEADRDRERERADEWLRGAHAERGREAKKPLGPAPDPSADPAAFQAWLAERDARTQAELEQRLETSERRITSQVEQRQTAAELWDRYVEAYPHEAARRDLAGVAYANLAARKALPQTADAIVVAVKREVDRLAGPRSANRTAGLSGGDRGNPNPKPKGGKPTDKGEKLPTLHESNMKIKQKYGLI